MACAQWWLAFDLPPANSPDIVNISDQKYVRLTTYTKDGRAKHTPVWVAGLPDNVVGTTTDSDSWKIKRLLSTSSVELAASDAKGGVADGVETMSGTARVVDYQAADYGQIESALLEKYGLQYRLFRFIRRLRRKEPCGIVIILD